MRTPATAILLFALGLLNIISSCNNSEANGQLIDTTAQQDSNSYEQTLKGKDVASLNLLSLKKKEFTDWYDAHTNSKLMFLFKTEANTKITLAGWASIDDDKYDPNPALTLDVSNITVLQLQGHEHFFGNLRIRKTELRDIRREFDKPENSNMKFLLFNPQLDNDNHVFYEIFLSADVSPITGLTKTRVGKTDPSPPATNR